MVNTRVCIVCGKIIPPSSNYLNTCGDACHETLCKRSEHLFGKDKKVVDIHTGRTHRVPTRVIIGKGLAYKDLKNYPLWEED